MRQGRLEGKVAIVTGGATGIGEAICHRFCKEGAKVVVNGLPTDPVDDVVAHIREQGGTATGFKGDVSDEAAAKACVETAVREFGKLDVLVNNAGVLLVIAQTEDYPVAAFDETLRMNCRSAFLMTRFALPHLRKTRGNVISAGSEAGYKGLMRNTPYGGTKAFIHAFMEGVAVEQAQHGIRANCVCPGPIDTAWTHRKTGPMDKTMEKEVIASTPLGRLGTPEEVANVYCFLASDEASFVTGALWLVDGGIVPAKGAVGLLASSAATTPPEPHLKHLRHQHDGNRNKDTKTVS